VRENQRIRLVVTSDVSDHVHLHGYDLMVDVAPGRPGRLTLRATVPGRFEVELEDRRLQILELEVRP
jgi:heme/copper-type cytochrome/quinol oxidase subunit 2